MMVFQVMAILGGALWLRSCIRWMRQRPVRNVRAVSHFGRCDG